MRPEVIPQLADAEEVLAAVRAPRGRRLLGPDPERARARAGAARCATASTRSTSSSPPRRPTTARTSTARSRSRWPGWSGRLATAREAGLRCEGVISTSFGCPYEGEVPPERVFGIAERLAARRLRGDRLRRHDRDGEPAPGRTSSSPPPASASPGRADRPLPQHPRPGPRQRAGGAGGGGRVVRVELRRARRLPGAARARPATSRPRTWSRCCTRWGSRPGSTCRG